MADEPLFSPYIGLIEQADIVIKTINIKTIFLKL